MQISVNQPASVDASERRYEDRVAVKPTTVTVHSDIFSQQVIILNVTRMGFLAKSRLRYKLDEWLTLHMPLIGPINARAAWFADGMLGARFISAIDDDAYATLLSHIAAEPRRITSGVMQSR
jgi:DDE superfamily endonuclease